MLRNVQLTASDSQSPLSLLINFVKLLKLLYLQVHADVNSIE